MTTAIGTSAVEIARELAAEFRDRAAAYDRTGEFPTANYDRMREAGYLRALVPEELGGLGADLAQIARAQQELARGDASTALAVNMHQFQVGVAADGYRNGMPTEALLRRIATEGIVLGSTGAESIVAGEWTCPTTADRDGDGYVLNGRKFFCSQAPGMNVVRVNATDTTTGETLVFAVPATAEGLRVVETWDTMGMRATASHDVVLENVRVPATAVGARWSGPPLRGPAMPNVSRWFLVLMSSVYLGIAEEARDEALRSIGNAINSNQRATALTDALVGEMETDLLIARSVRDRVAGELAEFPSDMQVALTKAILCKEAVTSAAIRVVDRAVEIAGGRAYFRKSPLERFSRDVRAARFHPPSAPVSFQIAGERTREFAAR